MNYYLIAGEASGDLHAANLMRELKLRDAAAHFRCWGGDLMQRQGGTIVKHYREMAYMGFVEVLMHLPAIYKNISQCKDDLLEHRPDVLILVDFPGFNLRIADFAQKKGIRVFYYISPKIWAWNQKRVLKIRRAVDHMFCILPFEVEFYRAWGMEVDYVGNPLVDAIEGWKKERGTGVLSGEEGLSFFNADRPIIALLPGSRKQEIKRILPEMLAAAERFPDYQTVIAGAPTFSAGFYQPFIGDRPVELVFDQTYELLSKASAALVTSGTATLETALLNVPQAVLYKANGLSVAIARRLLTIKFISLVNLIADRELVKELIQEDCKPQRLSEELKQLLRNEDYRSRLQNGYAQLRERVGGPGASARTAEKMLQYLSE